MLLISLRSRSDVSTPAVVSDWQLVEVTNSRGCPTSTKLLDSDVALSLTSYPEETSK